MEEVYSDQELNEAYLSLSEEQKKVLDSYIKRGMKTQWLNLWAKKKGAVLDSSELDDPEKVMETLLDWVLLDYEDSLTINPDTRCECGRALRYRYTILHKETGKIYKLGRVHFEQHTGLDPETVRLVMKGFKEIDTERAEILSKVISKWTLPFVIPLDLSVPKDMQEQLRVNLPLLNRQLYRLDMMIRQYYSDKSPVKHSSKKTQQAPRKTLVTTANTNTPDLSKVDIKYIYGKLKALQISGEEAKQLYYFIKDRAEEIERLGLNIEEIKKSATRALGKIGNPDVRKWLVEIESYFVL
jgi:hypothetical protein